MNVLSFDVLKEKTNYKKINVLKDDCKFTSISIYADDIKECSIFVAINTDKYSNEDGSLGFTGNEDSVFGLGGTKNGLNDIDLAIENGVQCVILDDEKFYERYIDKVSLILVNDCMEYLIELSKIVKDLKKFKVIAITGSVGKTTTTYLLYNVLKKLNYKIIKSNRVRSTKLGLCVDILNTLNECLDFFLFELQSDGMGQIENICEVIEIDYAIITNIKNCHLSKFKSIDNIFLEKTSILKFMNKDGVIFVDNDDVYLNAFYEKECSKITIVPVRNSLNCSTPQTKGKEIKFNIKSSKLNDIYVSTKPLSFVKCFIYHINDKLLDERSFETMVAEMSSNFLRYNSFIGRNDCKVIMDSYNGSFYSMKNGIESVCHKNSDKKIILILGSMLELGNESEKLHREIGRIISSQKNIYKVFLFGESMLYTYFEIKKTSINAEHFFDYSIMIDSLLETYCSNQHVIYIKGSGGMRMELIAPYILAEPKNSGM